MNIVILYRKSVDIDQEYPSDSEGRDGVDHVLRVKKALQSLGYEAHLLNLTLDNLTDLRKNNFDLVFNLCDDGFDNNALLEPHIPAMLDIFNIDYTGSNYFTLASCLNKARAKEILAFHNIPTVRFQIFENANESLNRCLHFPLIVKPLHEDASIGIRKDSVVTNNKKLKEMVEFVIKNYNQPALVERFIEGREVYVGILGSKPKETILPISEIFFNGFKKDEPKICSYDAKWVEESDAYQNTPVKCPAKMDKSLGDKLREIALKAYDLLECQDYGRVDFRIDQKGQPYVLEVNPNPDISEDAGLATMIKAQNKTYEDFIGTIVHSALDRKAAKVQQRREN